VKKVTVVSTPFPRVGFTASLFGVSQARVHGLEALVHSIHVGRDVSAVKSLAELRTGPIKYAKRKTAVSQKSRRKQAKKKR
jgi:hypothetical protein